MSSFGPVHTLIVYEVGEPYGPLSTEDFKDYEIIHPPECTVDLDERWTCGVGFNVEMTGARFCLKYVGTPVNEPGEYAIQAWAETYRGFDYTEHDGGIALCPKSVDSSEAPGVVAERQAEESTPVTGGD